MSFPIHVLWATPRSTSTAFEWMMRMRGDMTCFHEPFGEPWYLGPDARSEAQPTRESLRPDATFEAVWESLLAAAEQRPVFIKDMPHHTDHLWTDAFLDRLNHSFLIRDPAKVIASLQRSYDKSGMTSGFPPREVSFEAQHQLYDLLVKRTGKHPPIIDSDDLLEDPHRMVNAWCDAIGIPFIADALTWEPGDRDEVLWYEKDVNVWHGSLRDSTGLKEQPRKTVNLQDLPEAAREQHALFMPHYLYLHNARITAP